MTARIKSSAFFFWCSISEAIWLAFAYIEASIPPLPCRSHIDENEKARQQQSEFFALQEDVAQQAEGLAAVQAAVRDQLAKVARREELQGTCRCMV